jgi:hypothetical protein
MRENDIIAQGFEFVGTYGHDTRIYQKDNVGLLVYEKKVTFQYELMRR